VFILTNGTKQFMGRNIIFLPKRQITIESEVEMVRKKTGQKVKKHRRKHHNPHSSAAVRLRLQGFPHSLLAHRVHSIHSKHSKGRKKKFHS
jgi:hypothetical protein